MQKRIKKLEAEECKYNQIKTPTNVAFNIILIILSLICVVPFIFVVIISFTDDIYYRCRNRHRTAADRHLRLCAVQKDLRLP